MLVENNYLIENINEKEKELFFIFLEGCYKAGKVINPTKKYIEAFIAMITPFKRRNFINFINAISYKVDNIKIFKEQYKKYENKKVIEEMVEDVMNMKNSVGVIALAQFILNKVDNNENISHEEIVMIEILKELNDFDIENFIFLYENLDIQEIEGKENEITKKGFNYLSVKYSAQKLKNNYLCDGNSWVETGGGVKFNETGRGLYNFLEERSIDKILKENKK